MFHCDRKTMLRVAALGLCTLLLGAAVGRRSWADPAAGDGVPGGKMGEREGEQPGSRPSGAEQLRYPSGGGYIGRVWKVDKGRVQAEQNTDSASTGGQSAPDAPIHHRDETLFLDPRGPNKETQRAVAAALNWLARNQKFEGARSLDDFSARCQGDKCAGPGVRADTAATALALLPFLAAGQSHDHKAVYQRELIRGLHWLIGQPKKDGDLRGGFSMYAHALATLCLCEAYSTTRDTALKPAAELAVNFLVNAQDRHGGGWRYQPGEPGDTSVTGWHVMASKSAQLAEIAIPADVAARTRMFLNCCAVGPSNSRFTYLPASRDQTRIPGETITAEGLLCCQYLGVRRDDPQMVAGIGFPSAHPPDEKNPNIYYLYFATQVLRNARCTEWIDWNCKLRPLLVRLQCRKGCAAGSWDPDEKGFDKVGGRLCTTALAALTLEVYYPYFPLYKAAH